MKSTHIAELQSRLIALGVAIGRVSDLLPRNRMGEHIAGQIIRSGTSPAANYAEACSAESRRDFVHKLGICLKELRETLIWLEFIIQMRLSAADTIQPICREATELANIIARSILTAKGNGRDTRSQGLAP